MEYFNELLTILNEMSPFLLLGFLISGLLHVYVPRTLYTKFLQKKGFKSVIGAALLGVPLPLCSCGVIPTAISLKKEGASDGSTVAFLVGTPQTGVDSILATYSLLGLPFAIIRPVAAFFVAIFSGILVDKSKNNTPIANNKNSNIVCGCGCAHSHDQKPKKKSIWNALKYGYIDMMQDFGKWLIIGLLIAAAITAFIPDSIFTLFKDYYFLNILLILLISAPMYICATGSIPIALSLMLKGISPGAAFILLMAGPATNFASLFILHKEIGMQKTLIYLLSITIGAIVCALIIDFVFPQEWFSSISALSICGHDHSHDHAHVACNHGPIWWQTTTSVIFISLFITAFTLKYLKRKKIQKTDNNNTL